MTISDLNRRTNQGRRAGPEYEDSLIEITGCGLEQCCSKRDVRLNEVTVAKRGLVLILCCSWELLMDSIELEDAGPAKQSIKVEREMDSFESGERLLFLQFS